MHNPKHYYRPKTLDEAIRLANQPGALAIAGGALAFGALEIPYDTFIDLQDVRELKQIGYESYGITIGGAVTLQQVVEIPELPDALRHSITRTIPLNIRNNATVGETLMAKNPPREWIAALVALHDDAYNAVTYNYSGNNWETSTAPLLEGFGGAPGTVIVTNLIVPIPGNRQALGAAFVARTPTDDPIVNAAVCVSLNESGVVSWAQAALGGLSDRPVIRVDLPTLEGKPMDEATITHAANFVTTFVKPVSDFRGSAEYRREMARVTVQRALMECREQLEQ